ncbi:MAG TPA: DNA translocase FtsK 4TM domain-containing protein, partial [Actinomycetota bacterium]
MGIGLIVLSLLAALSLWLEAGGPVGRGISWLIHGSFGVGAYAFPVLGAWWGFVLLRDIAREDRVRMAIGFGVLVAGALGLASLFAGNPGLSDGWASDDGLAGAGGAIGALAAWPLARVISPIGSAIVCAGLASLGLLVFTGTPFAAVKEKIDAFRDERDERDPVAARAKDPERTERRRRWSLREAFGLTDDVIHLPEAGDGHEAATETIASVPEDPEFPSEPPLPAAGGSRSRTVKTPFGPYQLPPLDLFRTAPPS